MLRLPVTPMILPVWTRPHIHCLNPAWVFRGTPLASVLGNFESAAGDYIFTEARTFNHSAASCKAFSGRGELDLHEMCFFAGLVEKDHVVPPALNGTVLSFIGGKQPPSAVRAVFDIHF